MVIYVKTEKDKKKQIKKSSYIMRCWFLFFFLINLPNSDTWTRNIVQYLHNFKSSMRAKDCLQAIEKGLKTVNECKQKYIPSISTAQGKHNYFLL